MIPLDTNNFNDRKTDKIDMIVLHYTGMNSLSDAINRLCHRKSEVSCHYIIAKNGDIYQLVDEQYRAWHAGVSSWQGESDVNSRSIGIEIENKGHEFGYEEFNDIQIASVVGLCKNLIEKYHIPPLNVVAHSDIAPSRKKDPGELFPWDLLALNEIGIYPKDIDISEIPADFDYKKALENIGYSTTHFDDTIIAFKRHYVREDISPILDDVTKGKIYALNKIVNVALCEKEPE